MGTDMTSTIPALNLNKGYLKILKYDQVVTSLNPSGCSVFFSMLVSGKESEAELQLMRLRLTDSFQSTGTAKRSRTGMLVWWFAVVQVVFFGIHVASLEMNISTST